ncbi:MAG: hypothetical protein JW876_03255 [Candidatus Krumholzibacteriota bacterium]|nr:hypothetical protein [Candidatus Krumholzibacteriota bacterium]
MKSANALFLSLLILAATVISVPAPARAQCYGSLLLAPDFFKYDYLVRLCVHFGDVSAIPEGIDCSRSLVPGESPIEVPIYAYNVHDGIVSAWFAVESNDSIAGFDPRDGFEVDSEVLTVHDGYYSLDLKLSAFGPVCGPVLVGYALIVPTRGVDPIWVELTPNRMFFKMQVVDGYGDQHYLFPPQHGAYIGSSYLYTCQPPVCPEPNVQVMDLEASSGFGLSVKLVWTAGTGNTTVLRYRTDRFPTGYEDGEFVVSMPSAPGEHQQYFHTGAPRGQILYYAAFSLTTDGNGAVLKNGFVECESTDTTFTDGEIAVESSSWGDIKLRLD